MGRNELNKTNKPFFEPSQRTVSVPWDSSFGVPTAYVLGEKKYKILFDYVLLSRGLKDS